MNHIKAVCFATLLALAGAMAAQDKQNCRPANDGCNTVCESKDGTGATITLKNCGHTTTLEGQRFVLVPRKSEASALCGSHGETSAAEYYVACVDFDKLRELTGAPAFGKQTQVFVDARNQDVVAVRVTAKRGDETATYLAEPFKQPHGRRIAVAVFEGLDWETVAVQVLIEEK